MVLSQVYVPDPAAVGQHMHDVAAEMAKRGYRVISIASNRGYNDPSCKYMSREILDGVHVRRLPMTSFGKKNLALRVVAALSFVVQVIFHGLTTRGLRGILVSTSPPMCSAGALIIATFRPSAALTYWAMDLNPDQMVAMGWISADSPLVKCFDWFNRRVLRKATHVITLDQFMAERLLRKADIQDKLTVMPPWPHDSHLEMIDHQVNPFRKAHGLEGKFVIMYSGNHSVCTPLATILEAAIALREDPRIRFLFIGDGTGKKEVNDTIAKHNLKNAISLPYQPMSQIKYSLSAADVHLVVVGDKEVGIRHPCKIYGAMALARPILLLGPDPCHVSELVANCRIGWHIQHGDVQRAIACIQEMANLDPDVLRQMGQRAKNEVNRQLNQARLCSELCNLIERSMLESSSPAQRTAPTSEDHPR